jgi:hypothetical protein
MIATVSQQMMSVSLPAVLQVALLFLVKGPMHHEELWRQWFQTAAGQLPVQALSTALCSSDSSKGSSGEGDQAAGGEQQRLQVLQACRACAGSIPGSSPGVVPSPEARQAALANGSSLGSSSSSSSSSGSSRGWPVLDQQLLFDVQVHSQPNFTGYPPGSPFHGRELPLGERVATQWGTHRLVDAGKLWQRFHTLPLNLPTRV